MSARNGPHMAHIHSRYKPKNAAPRSRARAASAIGSCIITIHQFAIRYVTLLLLADGLKKLSDVSRDVKMSFPWFTASVGRSVRQSI